MYGIDGGFRKGGCRILPKIGRMTNFAENWTMSNFAANWTESESNFAANSHNNELLCCLIVPQI